jgi:uncharacterized membrane protein YsdA (DUF1294 family)/cold shock CspA family protein
MQYQGTIENWDDERGFGFVTPDGDGLRAFVHIKSFRTRWRRPVDGDVILYDLTLDEQNRNRAENIRYKYAGEMNVPEMRPVSLGVIFSVAFVGLLLALYALKMLPVVILLHYLILSLVAFLAYAFDKSAAKQKRWRTKESTLQALAFFSGWPGAVLGQRVFWHKVSKHEFQMVFWMLVCLNCGIFFWTLTKPGTETLRELKGSLLETRSATKNNDGRPATERNDEQLPRIIPLNRSSED